MMFGVFFRVKNGAGRKNHKWLIFKQTGHSLGGRGIAFGKACRGCRPVASPLDDFDFIIQPLHESAGVSVNKVIGDFLHMGFQRFQEMVKTGESAIAHPPHPALHFSQALAFGKGGIKNGS
jgi:hypothetical protein